MPFRELDKRTVDGIEVTLLFDDIVRDLTVLVEDHKTGDHFDFHPAPEDALEAFNHPYAYVVAIAR